MIKEFFNKIEVHEAIYKNSIKNKYFEQKLISLSLAIKDTIKNKGKIIFAGNGGSFADSLHISAEFTGKFKKQRDPYPSIVLGANFSYTTAVANDYGYQNIFLREFNSLANKNDLLICLTTSAKSNNIYDLVQLSKKKNIKYFVITGSNNGLFVNNENLLNIDSYDTDVIQEITIMILHSAVDYLEKNI
tara:strand:+ start:5961 stop:6527 length:567 start_codon:yes stop_codon:yes gene_type:complete